MMKKYTRLFLLLFFVFTECKKTIEVEPRQVDYSAIVGWGDSLTRGGGGNGTNYLKVLSKYTGLKTYNMGIGGQKSSEVKDRMVMNDTLKKYPTIIWVGRNNIPQHELIKRDIAEMVHELRHSNYIILGILNAADTTENKGDKRYNEITTLNNELAKTYSSHYIDIRSYLVSQYNPFDEQDVMNYEHDVIPASLRSDRVHLNSSGYTLIAKKIYENIDILLKQ